uniref:Retrotransposon gag protein n=1 Tax=Ascaris lumbricoides TaxID=6252 RepID=A0A0M3I082_ASCLU
MDEYEYVKLSELYVEIMIELVTQIREEMKQLHGKLMALMSKFTVTAVEAQQRMMAVFKNDARENNVGTGDV